MDGVGVKRRGVKRGKKKEKQRRKGKLKGPGHKLLMHKAQMHKWILLLLGMDATSLKANRSLSLCISFFTGQAPFQLHLSLGTINIQESGMGFGMLLPCAKLTSSAITIAARPQ